MPQGLLFLGFNVTSILFTFLIGLLLKDQDSDESTSSVHHDRRLTANYLVVFLEFFFFGLGWNLSKRKFMLNERLGAATKTICCRHELDAV